MTKNIFIRSFALTALVASMALQAHASDTHRPVVEMFTSQGCSSCPPADELAARLAGKDKAIVLSVPVDYWDYLGWKDTLAKPAFSARQRAYAAARADGQVYTPQAVVNGLTHAIGSREDAVIKAQDATRSKSGNITLKITEDSSALHVNVGSSNSAGSQEAVLWLVPVRKQADVAIGRGENGGRKVSYVNVARDYIRVGEWKGRETTIDIPVALAKPQGCDGYVVLLQPMINGKPGAILGAAASAGI
jgi:hypothetical protein